MKTIKQVDDLLARVVSTAGSRRSRYEIHRDAVDYIRSPQASGYRSLHQVVRYVANPSAKSANWSGLLVEIQLRTAHQHAWATAVEIIDILRRSDLKGGLGPADWRRFFLLASSRAAIYERMPLAPGTPESPDALREELAHLDHELNALRLLRDYTLSFGALGQALQRSKERTGNRYVLIKLDAKAHRYEFRQFKLTEAEEALAAYAALEQEVAEEPLLDAVLVVTDSIRALAQAYPTYAGDAHLFTRNMRQFIYRDR